MNKNTTICIDLAKTVFQVAVFNQAGKPLSNKEVSSKKMCQIIDQYPDANIFMEACGSAHYWARLFVKKGHKVGLIPPSISAKFRIGNKNDHNDAVSIFEASRSPRLHCVGIKTLEQQDIATYHKYRESYKKSQNQIGNRIRGFAREYGVNFSLSLSKLCQQVPDALEDAQNELTTIARQILSELLDDLMLVINKYKKITKEMNRLSRQIEPSQRLINIPGYGVLSATMVYAHFGSAEDFKRGRDASASLGIVPTHSGSGGHVNIGGISKRGNTYLRSLLINGARSVVSNIKDKTDGLSIWIRGLLTRKNFNTTVVAVANKLLRMAIAILKSGGQYQAPVAQVS